MPRKDKAKLSAAAEELFRHDLVGVKNELAAIGQAASEDLSRDARECLTLRKHICTEAVKIVQVEKEAKAVKDLEERLAATELAMREMQGTGASSLTLDQIEALPREGREPSTH